MRAGLAACGPAFGRGFADADDSVCIVEVCRNLDRERELVPEIGSAAGVGQSANRSPVRYLGVMSYDLLAIVAPE
jgi:hypothetical protein